LSPPFRYLFKSTNPFKFSKIVEISSKSFRIWVSSLLKIKFLTLLVLSSTVEFWFGFEIILTGRILTQHTLVETLTLRIIFILNYNSSEIMSPSRRNVSGKLQQVKQIPTLRHFVTYYDVLWRFVMFCDVLWRIVTFRDVLWRFVTFRDILWGHVGLIWNLHVWCYLVVFQICKFKASCFSCLKELSMYWRLIKRCQYFYLSKCFMKY
jgi:hypothetical protein